LNNDATKCCYHCGCPNHFSNECRDKATRKTFSEKEKKENYDRFKRFKGKANVAKEAPESEDDNFTLTAQAPRKSLKKDSWLLDSAASAHIINNKSYFHQYQETPRNTIRGMGSASQPGGGTIKISMQIENMTSNIKLKDILCIVLRQCDGSLIVAENGHGTSCLISHLTDKVAQPQRLSRSVVLCHIFSFGAR
jgi:hypothetical protein